jgi:hypothetical protein
MTWTSEIASVNQKWQFGVESTPGTAVPCTKIIPQLDLVPGMNGAVTPYTPSGYKYIGSQTQDWEETAITVNGVLDFNAMSYLMPSAFGLITPTLNGSSAVAYKWVGTPPITGSVQPQTYTMQQGDSVRARSMNRMMLSAFGYKWTPKSRPMISGTMFGNPMSDNITLTSSPTVIAEAPAAAEQFFYYLDLTSAGIGTTGLTRLFSVDYSFGNIAAAFYASNRPSIGPSGHVDQKPATALKLLLMTDAVGLAAMQSYWEKQTMLYWRAKATGPVIDNLQVVTLGTQSSGNFKLTYKGQQTGNLAYNAAASAVQTALVGLSTIGANNVTVSGSNGGPYSIVFPQTGTLGQDTTALVADFTGLGTPGNASINTQAQSYNLFQHDMALLAAKPNNFADSGGIYAVDWDLTCAFDPSWNSGQAQQMTVINTLSAL